MCTCIVQLRLHIFYLLLELLVLGNGGVCHIILALHTYIGQLNLYVVEFYLQILVVDFLCYQMFLAIHQTLC